MINIKTKNINGVELLKSIPDNSIDFVLTDPPYELEIHGGGAGFMKDRKLLNKHISYIGNGFDYDIYFSEYERVLKIMNAVIFCSNKQVSKIMNWFESRDYSVTLLVWKKPNPIPLGNGKYIGDTEFMIYIRGKNATFNNTGYKNQLRVFEYNVPAKKERIHPAEKPVNLLRRLLLIHTNPNDTVLDTFAGSFTIGIACFKENRNCIMSENDNQMYKKALIRLNIKMQQGSLF